MGKGVGTALNRVKFYYIFSAYILKTGGKAYGDYQMGSFP
jgi:hypothetical protein